jgi:NADH-quinone oxidoreductase subunit J
MTAFATPAQWILGIILILSSLGVILASKPVHASLYFLLTLFMLSLLYLQLSAQFIAVMQVLVYAGAILVIFMFVIILFQDAHQQIDKYPPRSSPALLIVSAATFLLALVFLGKRFIGLTTIKGNLPEDYGTVQSLGQALYVDFFFPFEAVILLFLIAVIGALYIGRKES